MKKRELRKLIIVKKHESGSKIRKGELWRMNRNEAMSMKKREDSLEVKKMRKSKEH